MYLDILLSILIGGLLSLGGVALGGFMVYRTKREAHETLFGNPPKGEVFSVDNFGEDFEEDALVTETPEVIKERSDEFVHQFAQNIGKEA